MKKIERASDLTQDRRNANSGSTRGSAAVAESLSRYGAGRSILVDKEGRIIAGNTTAANWTGADEIIVVPSDGSKLVVVQRTDLDLENDKEARELAHADNRTNQLGYTPKVENIDKDLLDGADLRWLWREDELEAMRGVVPGGGGEPEINLDRVPRNSGFEIVVVVNSEEEMVAARKAIQELGYFTK